MFIAMAVILALALIALIIYLLWFLAPETFTTAGGDDRAGLRPLLVINGPGQGENPTFARPMGSTYGEDDRIYVSDTENDRIAVFDERGTFLFEFGGKGIAKPLPGALSTWEEGLLNYPLGLDADEDGNIYVADFRNDQIQVFDAEGEFIRRFPDPAAPVGKGSSGQEGTGIAVTDVAVHDGKVYATDAFQVFVFTTEGEFVEQFGKPGTWEGDLDHPNGIDVGEDGTIYVSDSNHNRVDRLRRRWRGRLDARGAGGRDRREGRSHVRTSARAGRARRRFDPRGGRVRVRARQDIRRLARRSRGTESGAPSRPR